MYIKLSLSQTALFSFFFCSFKANNIGEVIPALMDHFEGDVYLKTVQRLLQPQNNSIKHLFIMPYNLNL